MSNPLDFSGKVALVTGAAAGMGLATAKAFGDAVRMSCLQILKSTSGER